MDAKITKQRLSRMLSYDWLKIIGIAAVGIIIWVLIFAVTATGITPAQQFTVFNHYANGALDGGKFEEMYDASIDNGVFSYEVLETDLIDLVEAGDNKYTMCDSRFKTGQGDMIYVPQIADVEKKIETTAESGETVTEYPLTYVESFFARYFGYMMTWDEYFEQAHAYLTVYFGEDYANGTLNKEKAEEDFRARVKETRDKRFRRDAKLEQGVKDEFVRLEKYRDGIVRLEGYLASGVVRLENVQLKDEQGNPYVEDEFGQVILEGNYALNICPNENVMGGLKDQIFYSVQLEDGTKKKSSQDMCVMLFDLREMDDNFQYETVLHINSVIESALTPTAA